MALEQLTQLVNAGVVAVSEGWDGLTISGAVNDSLLLAELEAAGDLSREENGALLFMPHGDDLDSLLVGLDRKSKANAAALKIRGNRVKIDGVKEFDKQRAQMLRQTGKALKDVYGTAIEEVTAQLEAIAAIDSDTLDPAEAAKLAFRRGQLEAVLDQLGEQLANAGTQAENLATAQLSQAASIGSNVARWQIDNVTGKGIARFLGVDYAQLAVHNKYDLIAWAKITDKRKAVQKLRQEIGKGVLMGEHPGEIAKRLEGTFNQWRNRAQTIAQTETCRVMSEAAQETYAAAKEQYDLKIRNEWVATLDGRTRSSHADVDGEVREIGEKFSNGSLRPGQGRPAEAINCRCCLAPVVDGFEPDADVRRDNITGEMIPYQRYNDWAKGNGAPTTTAHAVPKHGIDANAKVYERVGEKYCKKLDDIMQDADPRARAVYKKFEGQYVLHDGNARDGAYFYNLTNGVYLNLEEIYTERTGSMVTWFHEFGHMTDYLAEDNINGLARYFSIQYKDNLFGKTLRQEVEAIITDRQSGLRDAAEKAIKDLDFDKLLEIGVIDKRTKDYLSSVNESAAKNVLKSLILSGKSKLKKNAAMKALENELKALGMTDAQRADLSDILDAVTRGGVSLGWGHGKKYWQTQDKLYGKDGGLAKEAFAEFMSAYMSNHDSLEVMRKYLPESAKVFDEMIDQLGKD